MKSRWKWQLFLGLGLIFLSALVYFIHYLVFRDAHHIFIYLIGDIGFVFLEVLLVTLIIHRLLVHREKQMLIKKLNMVIGVFFSEVGTNLLKQISVFDKKVKDISGRLVVTNDWADNEFRQLKKYLYRYDGDIDVNRAGLEKLRDILVTKRTFLVNLLENPNLLEHDSFTDTLWAVFHLAEELSKRDNFTKLPQTDLEHLAKDVKRSYQNLIGEWIDYIEHLKESYPYLFSLAIRTNPFDKFASVVID
jgi:signal transduction histidine kinase